MKDDFYRAADTIAPTAPTSGLTPYDVLRESQMNYVHVHIITFHIILY